MSKTSDWTVLKMMEWATEYFQHRKIQSPRLSIEWLLSHVLGIKRLQLYMQFDRPLTQTELESLREMVKRRSKHEPLQYITGSTSFFNAEIQVSPAVLIPRPETEELVELILNENQHDKLNLLDIGTGSGCIPIACKMERPNWNIFAIDISNEALNLARLNSEQNNVEILLSSGDLFDENLLGDSNFEIIVSNPPYIHLEEAIEMDVQVKDYEPRLALFCDDRSSVYSSIIRNASRLLTPGGKLYLELHHEYEIEAEKELFNGDWNYQILRDVGGQRRFFKGTYKG
jgi:release factor glutamine methyltransferase